jgi:threonine dehydrogenase-like Zn-dependent dehydrogenase
LLNRVVETEPQRNDQDNVRPTRKETLWAIQLNGKINPGKVFDLTLPLDQVADSHRAMDERRAIKTLLRP